MKKLLLSMALLAGMTFVACSDDDGGKDHCQICEMSEVSFNVCRGDNGNAFINNEDQGIKYEIYMEANCPNWNPPGSPDPSEPGDCVTCEAYEMMGQTFPAEEVCKAENGNAIIDGEELDMPYESYVQASELITDCN